MLIAEHDAPRGRRPAKGHPTVGRRARLGLGAAALALAAGLLLPLTAAAQSSDQIAQAQRYLANLGHYSGSIDGVSGPGTSNAIRRFQEAAGIVVSGELDELTWVALQRQGGEAGGSPNQVASNDRAETPIEEAQRILQWLGYNPGEADGAMGPDTRAALESFQLANGLEIDGAVGAETLSVLRERLAELHAGGGSEDGGDPNVREAQLLLNQLGYGPVSVDGEMGPATSQAIAQFQRAVGLNHNGRLTPATLDRLRMRVPSEETRTDPTIRDAQEWLDLLGYNVSTADGVLGPETVRAISRFQSDENLRRTGTLTPETYERLRARAQDVTDIPRENPFIEEAQTLLADAGYDPGPIDGMTGGRTEEALRQFQTAENLRVTGTLTLETLNALRGETNEDSEILDFWTMQHAQQMLRELAYFSGPADGVLGPQTATSLARFQASNGLTPSGTLTVATLNLLEDQVSAYESAVMSVAVQFWAYQFEDYPADEPYKGDPAELDPTSHPMASRVDPLDLLVQYEPPPAFAGKYAIIGLALDTGTAPLTLVVDMETGLITSAISSSYGVQYQHDSRLIVADAIQDPDGFDEVERGLRPAPTYYVVNADGSLTELDPADSDNAEALDPDMPTN